MNVVRRERIDWEPLSISLVLRTGCRASTGLLRFVPEWLKTRRRDGVCKCDARYFAFREAERRNDVAFACEWMCERCVTALADEIAAGFPEVSRVEIGHDDEGLAAPPSDFVSVPAKTVWSQDGRPRDVEAFLIARSCVTIGQFEDFAAATGYATTAERHGEFESYRDNQMIPSKRDRRNFEAHRVSYHDALAYCTWSNTRLPTSDEWIAAAVIDDRVYGKDDAREVWQRLHARPDALRFGGNDWTQTTGPGGGMIQRGWPQLAWSERELGHQPSEATPDDTDIMNTFRVVRAT
jgi:hypothetical protein